jgi:hypothetical protein
MEFFLRNFVAYEEYMSNLGSSEKLVIHYITFMDRLINSSKDVEILR